MSFVSDLLGGGKKAGNQAVESANRAQDIREETGDFVGGIARDQRDFYDENIVPLDDRLSSDVMGGLNPDYASLRSNARNEVAKSYRKASQALKRRLAKYGQAMTPQDQRALDFQRDKSEVYVANKTADAARDEGIDRATQYYGMGSDLPGVAAGGETAAGLGLSNYYDYQSRQDANRSLEQNRGLQGIVQGVAGAFLADGGEVNMNLGEPVDLETGNFIMKASVVKALGKEFFDKMVEEASMAQNQEGEDGYAAGGLVRYDDGGYVGTTTGVGKLNRFMGGLRRGFTDRREREFADERLAGMKSDRMYTEKERTRQDRINAVQDQATMFSNELQQAAGRVIATGGADYRAPIDTYNAKFPSDTKLDAVRNEDGTFDMYSVGADQVKKPIKQKMSLKDYVQGWHALSYPKLYAEAALKGGSQERYATTVSDGVSYTTDKTTGKVTKQGEPVVKSEYTESDRGILDKKTGKFNPHPDSIRKAKVDRADANEKEARLLANAAWGQLGANGMINFSGDAADRAAENAELTMQVFRQQGNTDMNSAHRKALQIVRSKKARGESRGPMKGADTAYIFNNFSAEEAARELMSLFPGGLDEQEARQLMARRGISDAQEQDQVLEQVNSMSDASGLGLQRPPATNAAPAQKAQPLKSTFKAPNGRVVSMAEIQATAKNRKITPEEVIRILKLQ
jgi:hypothetical protein